MRINALIWGRQPTRQPHHRHWHKWRIKNLSSLKKFVLKAPWNMESFFQFYSWWLKKMSSNSFETLEIRSIWLKILFGEFCGFQRSILRRLLQIYYDNNLPLIDTIVTTVNEFICNNLASLLVLCHTWTQTYVIARGDQG